MTSFLKAGHAVRLFCYDTIQGVPSGVEVCDASALASKSTILSLRHKKSGSYALASDYFRYRIFENGLGFWSDTDVICLRPIDLQTPYVFGWEDGTHVNGAFLYLEKDSPILEEALTLFANNSIPPWVKFKKAWPYKMRQIFGVQFGPADLPWGSFGPSALTALVKKFDLQDAVLDQKVLYPITVKQARSLLDINFPWEDHIIDQSFTIHLWNERLKGVDKNNPPKGSPLEKIYDRVGV